MIFDKTLIFSDEQAITGDAASTNIVDLGATGTPYGGNALVRDIGKGHKVPLFVFINASFNNLTSLNVHLEVDTVENFASPKIVAKATFALADLTAGSVLHFPDCVLEGANQRYLRLNYDVVGTDPTTGSITAGVVAARQTNFADHF